MSAPSDVLLLVPQGERGTLVVSGRDRVTWLNGVVTCDVAAVSPRRGALGLVLTKTGKILSDLFVVAGDDVLLLGVTPGKAAELLAYLARMLVMEDAELVEQSSAWAWFTLHGPAALEHAARVADAVGGAAGTLELSGPPAVALAVPYSERDAAIAALAKPGSGVVIADAEAWERFRVANGIGVYGTDFGAEDNPHEAGLDQRAVSWTKGCYLGQEVVCMQGMRGKLKRRLVTLTLAGDTLPPVGADVTASDGSVVGDVTSRALVDGRVFALARVSSTGSDASASLFVAGVSATIVEHTAAA